MDITSELKKIKEEARGEDVRDAIVSALQKMAGAFTTTSKKITQNGTFAAKNDSVDGFSDVVVDVVPNLGTKTIQENGTFSASDDSFDGYSAVTVDVKGGGDVKLVEKTFTANGTYKALEDSADGYSTVVVDIDGSCIPFNVSIDNNKDKYTTIGEIKDYDAVTKVTRIYTDYVNGYSTINITPSGLEDGKYYLLEMHFYSIEPMQGAYPLEASISSNTFSSSSRLPVNQNVTTASSSVVVSNNCVLSVKLYGLVPSRKYGVIYMLLRVRELSAKFNMPDEYTPTTILSDYIDSVKGATEYEIKGNVVEMHFNINSSSGSNPTFTPTIALNNTLPFKGDVGITISVDRKSASKWSPSWNWTINCGTTVSPERTDNEQTTKTTLSEGLRSQIEVTIIADGMYDSDSYTDLSDRLNISLDFSNAVEIWPK